MAIIVSPRASIAALHASLATPASDGLLKCAIANDLIIIIIIIIIIHSCTAFRYRINGRGYERDRQIKGWTD